MKQREELSYQTQSSSPKKVSHLKPCYALFFVPDNGKKRTVLLKTRNHSIYVFLKTIPLWTQWTRNGATKILYEQYLTPCTSPVLKTLAHLVCYLLYTLCLFLVKDLMSLSENNLSLKSGLLLFYRNKKSFKIII